MLPHTKPNQDSKKVVGIVLDETSSKTKTLIKHIINNQSQVPNNKETAILTIDSSRPNKAIETVHKICRTDAVGP